MAKAHKLGDDFAKIVRELRTRPESRPEDYEDLLLEAIQYDVDLDDTDELEAVSYDDWEFDHGSSRRFYVDGLRRFMRETGIQTVDAIAGYGEAAVKEVAEKTDWAKMPNSNSHWTDSIATNQFRHARNGVPVFFQKAALIIVACELAAGDAIEKAAKANKNKDSKKDDKEISLKSASEIYSFMSIRPACYNVDRFNKGYFEDLDKTQKRQLRKRTGQSEDALLHLAIGHTVTIKTAVNVGQLIRTDESFDEVGDVRGYPGKKTLGKKSASSSEKI